MISIQEAPLKRGIKVFVRADLDVPIEFDNPLKKGQILETERLDRMLKTLNFISRKGGFPIIAGHIGRPEGKYVEELSTKYLLPYFNEKLGENAFELMENLRFDPREEQNSDEFAQELASKAHIYVNECFSTCHREHTSIVGPPKYIKSYAGFRLQEEIETLKKVLEKPKRPLVLIIGGAKLKDKEPVVSKFLSTADYILLGGKVPLEWDKEVPENLILPVDYAEENKDIGPQTINKFREIVEKAKTIVWAGPLGAYERTKFLQGTKEVAEAIASATQNNSAFSLIGGGDTIAAVNKSGVLDKISFASSGGGAMLTFLATGTLVGIQALQ